MCTGIALALSNVPVDVAADPRLAKRVYEREGRKELRFLWMQKPSILPVWWEGQFRILPWGAGKGTGLPRTGWVMREEIYAGVFAHVRPEEVLIPAQLGIERGAWFVLSEGIRGVVARSGNGAPHVYMLMEPASNYYRNMTEQSKTMPVLVGQVI